MEENYAVKSKTYTDGELFRIIAQCDQESIESQKAFSEIHRRYAHFIWNLCLRYCKYERESREIAKELTNDSLYKAFKNAHRFDDRKSAKAWLGTIAVNAALDYKKGIKKLELDYWDENQPDIVAENEEWVNKNPRLTGIFNIAFSRLEEHKREVLRSYLRHFEVDDFGSNCKLPPYEVEMLIEAFPDIIKNKYYISKLRDRAWQEILRICNEMQSDN